MAAYGTCARCQAAHCRECLRDGVHCATCLGALCDKERAATRRLRLWGPAAAIGLGVATVAIGLALGRPWVAEVGATGAVVAILLLVVGLRAETRARRAGLPTATDA